jgi:hypothetical protein
MVADVAFAVDDALHCFVADAPRMTANPTHLHRLPSVQPVGRIAIRRHESPSELRHRAGVIGGSRSALRTSAAMHRDLPVGREMRSIVVLFAAFPSIFGRKMTCAKKTISPAFSIR